MSDSSEAWVSICGGPGGEKKKVCGLEKCIENEIRGREAT